MSQPPLEALTRNPVPFSGELPFNEAMESDMKTDLDDIFIPNKDSKAYERSTIFHAYPKLWLQLVEYNICPSSAAMDDLKVIFMLPPNLPPKDDFVITHDIAMMLQRNQKIRVEERKLKFIALHVDKVVVPDMSKKNKKKKEQQRSKIEYIKTEEPTPAPFTWEPVNAVVK